MEVGGNFSLSHIGDSSILVLCLLSHTTQLRSGGLTKNKGNIEKWSSLGVSFVLSAQQSYLDLHKSIAQLLVLY